MELSQIWQLKNNKKIACLTAYDALFAKIVDESDAEVVLIGDSLGMVIKGEANTLGVSMAEMVYHTKIVARQVQHSYVISDLPYRSYLEPKTTLKNAKKLCGVGADMVKLEGGADQVDNIKILVKNKIAVCGHLGLQPQSIELLGGYKVQGKTPKQAQKILDDAKLLEKLGIGLLIIECVPQALAKQITKALTIPVIGIGAGADCDGQILVSTDILGMGSIPKFAKNFLSNNSSISGAVGAYVEAVKKSLFP